MRWFEVSKARTGRTVQGDTDTIQANAEAIGGLVMKGWKLKFHSTLVQSTDVGRAFTSIVASVFDEGLLNAQLHSTEEEAVVGRSSSRPAEMSTVSPQLLLWKRSWVCAIWMLIAEAIAEGEASHPSASRFPSHREVLESLYFLVWVALVRPDHPPTPWPQEQYVCLVPEVKGFWYTFKVLNVD